LIADYLNSRINKRQSAFEKCYTYTYTRIFFLSSGLRRNVIICFIIISAARKKIGFFFLFFWNYYLNISFLHTSKGLVLGFNSTGYLRISLNLLKVVFPVASIKWLVSFHVQFSVLEWPTVFLQEFLSRGLGQNKVPRLHYKIEYLWLIDYI